MLLEYRRVTSLRIWKSQKKKTNPRMILSKIFFSISLTWRRASLKTRLSLLPSEILPPFLTFFRCPFSLSNNSARPFDRGNPMTLSINCERRLWNEIPQKWYSVLFTFHLLAFYSTSIYHLMRLILDSTVREGQGDWAITTLPSLPLPVSLTRNAVIGLWSFSWILTLLKKYQPLCFPLCSKFLGFTFLILSC